MPDRSVGRGGLSSIYMRHEMGAGRLTLMYSSSGNRIPCWMRCALVETACNAAI